MSKFNIGDHVITIENGEIRKGVVKSVFSVLSICIVEFEDGSYEKVAVDQLALAPKNDASTDAETPEEKIEPRDSDKRITKSEFLDAIARVTSPEDMLGDKVADVDPNRLMLSSLAISLVAFKICDKIYGDDDVVYITRDQLKTIIAENTTPTALAENTNDEMSSVSVLPIAIISMLVLTRLVRVLFDEADND